jgi:hypothetical protein
MVCWLVNDGGVIIVAEMQRTTVSAKWPSRGGVRVRRDFSASLRARLDQGLVALELNASLHHGRLAEHTVSAPLVSERLIGLPSPPDPR